MQNKLITIIEGCKKGKQKEQMQLYDMYCSAMFNIACRYLINEEDAKDAMQDGFLKAFSKIETYRSDFTIGAWLKRIIINQCIDNLKKRKLEFTDIDVKHLELIDDNNWAIASSISKETIVNSINQLSEKYKLVVNLYLIEGL